MGLLDKLKNVFFEEEYIEVEEKNEPKEKVTVAKKIETPEVRKKEEPIVEEVKMKIEEDIEETTPPKEEKDFKFPMSFDDKDFEVEKTIEMERPIKEKEEHIVEEIKEEPRTVEVIETRRYNYEEVVNKEPSIDENLYHKPYEGNKEKEEKQSFKPSPIISPIYGILNKNYTKDEIVSKREVRLSQVSTKKADLDVIREKAYGDLAGEISASIEENPNKETRGEKEDLLYDLNEDDSPTVKVVTVGDAEEYFNDLGLEYNVDYKVEKEEEKVRREDVKPSIKEENKINIEESNGDDKNLFDLIDSMYEDKEKE